MSWGNFVLDKGYDAAAAITKFRFVKYSAAEQVTPVTGIGDDVAGVAQFGVTAGEILKGKGTTVRMIGVSEVEASGAIAVGQRVELVADGRVKLLVAASGARAVGKCVGHASTNAGDRIACLIFQGGALA
jgi:hypothetical protein